MFKVMVPAFVVPSTEAQAVLGIRLRDAAAAAWRELARRGKGFEMAHFQIAYDGVTLVVASGIRSDGCVQIELGMGDPRQAARVITAAELRRAEARLHRRSGPAPR